MALRADVPADQVFVCAQIRRSKHVPRQLPKNAVPDKDEPDAAWYGIMDGCVGEDLEIILRSHELVVFLGNDQLFVRPCHNKLDNYQLLRHYVMNSGWRLTLPDRETR